MLGKVILHLKKRSVRVLYQRSDTMYMHYQTVSWSIQLKLFPALYVLNVELLSLWSAGTLNFTGCQKCQLPISMIVYTLPETVRHNAWLSYLYTFVNDFHFLCVLIFQQPRKLLLLPDTYFSYGY